MAGYRCKDKKYATLVQYLTYLDMGTAWIKAGFGGANPAQSCWNLLNRRPDLRAEIERIQEENLEVAKKEKEDYLRFLNDVTFKEGEFANADDLSVKDRTKACNLAMKAEGCEGVSKIEASGGFNLEMFFGDEDIEDEEE